MRPLRVPVVLYVAASICAGLAAGIFASQLAAPKTPELDVANPIHDFGTAPVNARLNGTFELRNSGRAMLVVAVSKVSCSCTVTNTSELHIPPGAQAALPFEFEVNSSEGPCGSTISLKTNDPKSPEFILGVRADAISLVNLDNRVMYFGAHQAESLPAERVLHISPGKAAPKHLLEGLSVTADSPHTKVTKTSDAGGASLTVALMPTIPLGIFRDTVRLSFSNYRNYEIIVPVLAEIAGPVQVTPTALDFGIVTATQRPSLKCQLVSRLSGQLHASIVNDSIPKGFACNIVSEADGQQVLIAEMDPLESPATIDQTLLIDILCGVNTFRIQVPILAIVRK